MPIQLKNLSPMLITCFLAGLVLAVLAPFGTHSFALPYRLLYWIGLCLAGGIGAGLADLIAYILKREFAPWPRALLQSITATILVTSVILIMTKYAYGMLNFMQTLNVLMYVWVISATISAVGALMNSKKSDTKNSTSQRAALYERLPPHLRSSEIYALAAEDHYVRIITSKGDELVLMRLSDAIKETTPLIGISPHRSYWVAEKGVKKVGKSDLTLHTEQNIPISRNGMKLVREAGWV